MAKYSKKILGVLLAMCVMASLFTCLYGLTANAVEDVEYVQNGTFDTDLSYWTGISGDPVPSSSATWAADGTCLIVAWKAVWQTVTLEANTDYVLSFKAIREADSSGNLDYAVRKSDASTDIMSGSAAVEGGSSRNVKANFNTGENTEIKLRFGSAGNFKIDDVSIRKYKEPDPDCEHINTHIVEAVASTCKTQGNAEYTICDDCGVVVAGSNEPLPLDPNNHEGETEIRNDILPSDTEDGYTGDTYCLGCGAKIADGEIIPAGSILEEDLEYIKNGTFDTDLSHWTNWTGDPVPSSSATWGSDGTCNIVAWQAVWQTLTLKANTDYVLTFKAIREVDSEGKLDYAIRKTDTATNIFSDSVTIGGKSTKTVRTIFNTGDNTVVMLRFYSAVKFKIDNVSVKKYNPNCEHVAGDWETDADNHWHICSKCYDEFDKAAHTDSDWIVDLEPTATANGHKHKECTICGYVLAEEDIEKLQPTHIAGDINGDGALNNKDLTRLFQYLSEWDVQVNADALDVNGDGDVNNKDLTRLFQYLSEWDVQIY